MLACISRSNHLNVSDVILLCDDVMVTIRWLLQNFPDQCRAQASGGETPMLIAAAQGSKECLSILASATPSSRQEIIRDTDVNGLSSVHLASLFDRGSCVKWLLKHFGHRLVVLQSQSGITPVHIAGATGRLCQHTYQYLICRHLALTDSSSPFLWDATYFSQLADMAFCLYTQPSHTRAPRYRRVP